MTLDSVDISRVDVHAEVLEKVVRKLRAGQMPPAGRPRPDAATVDAFATALETALDRESATMPNPGRVASRRMNRVEYVNAIEDLLALQVNGAELLPSDMAGFGFDNNADVLAMTPSLMTRYIAAATKVSRAAVGSLDNRPMMQVYEVGFEERDVRVNEDMPFSTIGGLSQRHMFPLDGDYIFAVRLKRNATVETIEGIEEDEHEIELRVDHELITRWEIGGRFPGPDPGVLIAVPEDDVEGQRLHEYRMTADDALEIRVPIEAGQRLVSVAFTDSAPSPHGLRGQPGIDKLFISGPFGGHRAGRHAEPAADLRLPAGGRRAGRRAGGVRAGDHRHPRAARVPPAGHRRRRRPARRRLSRRRGRTRLRLRHRARPRGAPVDARVPHARLSRAGRPGRPGSRTG